MEFTEPKVGDRIFYSGRITTIDSFDEDDGTHLRSGHWVCMSEFEKNADGVWQKQGPPRTYLIGETYRAADLRAGVRVIRAAVLESGRNPKVLTTSPCCKFHPRRLDFGDLSSSLAVKQDGWTEQCPECEAYYRVSLVFTESPLLGLYGVCWESLGV